MLNQLPIQAIYLLTAVRLLLSSQSLPLRTTTSLGGDPACGLAWSRGGGYTFATWTVEPTIESIIATLKTAIGINKEYDVRLLHKGASTKLYDVTFDNQAFVMRVSLPVCPRTKTEAEVATLDWVIQHTPLPVPRVRAYDSSRDNPLGFEWILMTKLEGTPLSQCWSSMTIGSKERLVKQIAAFAASTFDQPFDDGIGSIFKAAPNSGGRATVDHGRGPFSETSDWMRSRLRAALSDLRSQLIDDTTNENEKATLRHMSKLTRRIERLMPKFLPSSHETASRETALGNAECRPVMTMMKTMLCHDDLSFDNILINDDGLLGGVIDWQWISCVPLYEACQFPVFLQQACDRFREPAGRFYLIDEDGPPHPAYFRDYKRYEVTKLRQLYIEEMLDRAPGFVDVWRDEASANLRDYEAVIQNCDNKFAISLVEDWVEAIEQGRAPKRLHELLIR
ncbi:phosphotransferase enzyme family-domain-containing protein [Nemania abortiva]|nr:phosphotransferase enzyme family-domain-containing protein [Nemania abortiva]